MRYGTVQYSTVQYSAVKLHSTALMQYETEVNINIITIWELGPIIYRAITVFSIINLGPTNKPACQRYNSKKSGRGRVGEEGRPCTKRKPNYAERGTEFGITPVQGKRGFFQLNDDHHWKEDFRNLREKRGTSLKFKVQEQKRILRLFRGPT